MKINVPIQEHQLLQLLIITLHKLGGTLKITEQDLLAYHGRNFNIAQFQEAEPDQDGYLCVKDGGEVIIRLTENEPTLVVPSGGIH